MVHTYSLPPSNPAILRRHHSNHTETEMRGGVIWVDLNSITIQLSLVLVASLSPTGVYHTYKADYMRLDPIHIVQKLKG